MKLVCRFDTILARLVKPSVISLPRIEPCFFETRSNGVFDLCSGEATLPDPDRVQGSLELCRPENELVHFIHTVKHPTLPDLANARNASAWCIGGVSARNEAAASGGGSAAAAYRRLDRRSRKGVGKYSGTLGPSGIDLST